jgi:thymidylate kinase
MGKIIVIEGSHCSGKSTTIRSLCSNYDFIESKSVPEWFREYIPYARSKGYEEQMTLYEI